MSRVLERVSRVSVGGSSPNLDYAYNTIIILDLHFLKLETLNQNQRKNGTCISHHNHSGNSCGSLHLSAIKTPPYCPSSWMDLAYFHGLRRSKRFRLWLALCHFSNLMFKSPFDSDIQIYILIYLNLFRYIKCVILSIIFMIIFILTKAIYVHHRVCNDVNISSS